MPTPLPDLAPLTALENAHLRWNNASPEAVDFDDVYFSREDGRQETEHVFIHNNHLEERFAQWQVQRPFVIAETGFGSGLNAMCAWAAFEHHAPRTARLHFVSVERFPMTADALERALGAWPEFALHAKELVSQWPIAVVGVHRIIINDRFTIDLHFGEASERFNQFDGYVDAWFLDGFAPSRNPDMWQDSLFNAMARASRPGATFATFTAAGFVKRGLAAAGFECEKVRGFGRKRDMLRGTIPLPPKDARRASTPWFAASQPDPERQQHIAIIGAGIAGCSTAYALAQRGYKVMLFDPQGVALGASGNHQAALYIKLAINANLQSRFYLAALMHLRRMLERSAPNAAWWDGCGTLDISLDEKQAERQQRFLRQCLPEAIVRGMSPDEASTLAHIDLSHIKHALFYPLGGWLSPREFCQHLIDHTLIDFNQCSVEKLIQGNDEWQLELSNGEKASADHIVVCTSFRTNDFPQLSHLTLYPVRGQVSLLDVTSEAPRLGCVICAGGYAPPSYQGRMVFGASFVPNNMDMVPNDEDTTHNRHELTKALPDFVHHLEESGIDLCNTDARVGIRTASADKSPFAGAAPDADSWQQLYAALGKDSRRIAPEVGPRINHLWVNVAHGSRGMVSAPLCAELIASKINGEPAPMELALVDHLDPGRRIIRDIITRKKGN